MSNQYERLIPHSHSQISSNDPSFSNQLYGEYDHAPPTVTPKDSADEERPTSTISQYAKMFVQIFLSVCATGFALLCRLVCIAFTVTLVVIGSYYVHNCSCQPFIPVYLIVTGCLLCLLIFYAVYQSCKQNANIENSLELSDSSRNIFRYCKDFLTLFVFAWFIAGSVTVYQIYWKINFNNVTAECYCQPLLYKFTFWSITSFYMILASVLMIGLIGMFVKYLYSCCDNREY